MTTNADVLHRLGQVEDTLARRIEDTERRVADLGHKVDAHIADEDDLKRSVERLATSVEGMATTYDAIVGRLDAGADRMATMTAELQRNTEITETIRDQRTFWRVLKERWKALSFWLASIGAAAYGVWQAWSVWRNGGGGGA